LYSALEFMLTCALLMTRCNVRYGGGDTGMYLWNPAFYVVPIFWVLSGFYCCNAKPCSEVSHDCSRRKEGLGGKKKTKPTILNCNVSSGMLSANKSERACSASQLV